MKNLKYLAMMAIFFISLDAFSMSLFRAIRNRGGDSSPPSSPPQTRPDPTPTPTPTPTPAPDPQQPSPSQPPLFDIFNEVAFPVGDSVDAYYSNYRELLPAREDVSLHQVDTCHEDLEGQESFVDRIAYFVHEHTSPSKAHLAHLAPYYDVPSSLSQHVATSLTTQNLCPVTRSTLSQTIGSSRVPAQSVIEMLNNFSQKHNRLKQAKDGGDIQAEVELNQLWTRFMSCLSYTESLTSADTSTSQNVARKYAPSNYRKPAGVKFYEDRYQNPASRLNIGLFQFTPNGGGNINPCLRQWNQNNSSCQVSTSSSQAELIRVFGSGKQTMNAYCGVNKILQTFAIQVNTTSGRSTHPQNRGVAAEQRCVTPFFYSGWAYNHFGPLMNSTGKNMETLMKCVMR